MFKIPAGDQSNKKVNFLVPGKRVFHPIASKPKRVKTSNQVSSTTFSRGGVGHEFYNELSVEEGCPQEEEDQEKVVEKVLEEMVKEVSKSDESVKSVKVFKISIKIMLIFTFILVFSVAPYFFGRFSPMQQI